MVGAKSASVRKTTGRSAYSRIAVGKYTMLKLNEVKESLNILKNGVLFKMLLLFK